LKSYIFIKN